MRLTLADAKASRIPRAIGVCSTDSKFLAILNEAMQRLMRRGFWWGNYGRYRICTSDGCITLPPQLAAIDSVAMCGVPQPMHDQWFEFMANGPGPVNGRCNTSTDTSSVCGQGISSSCNQGGFLRGHFPTFKDIQPTGKKLNFVCDLASDVGKTVLALGFDDNGNWIRTSQGGSILDGEVIAFAQGGGTNSTNNFSSVSDIQLPSNMDGQSWLYEYKVSDTTRRLIGKYQYFETRPSYPRYLFPSIRTSTNTDGSCDQTSVEIMARHEYIPLVKDTDYLILSNIPALKAMCVGIDQSEKEPDPIKKNQIMAMAYGEALTELDYELDSYLGAGRLIGVQNVGSSVLLNDPVVNII